MFNHLPASTPRSWMRKTKLSKQVMDALRAKYLVLDSEFDRILPFRYQTVSEIHWTPIDVAVAIAQMVENLPTRRFIDLGAGTGKLCVLLALMTDHFISGVESSEGSTSFLPAASSVMTWSPGALILFRATCWI